MVRKSGQDNPLRSRILIAAPKVITPNANCMGTLAAPRASFNSIKKSSNPARGSLIIGLSQFKTATDTKHSAVRPIQFFQWPVIIFSPTMPQRVVLALLVYDMFFLCHCWLLVPAQDPRNRTRSAQEAEARASCFGFALCDGRTN